MGVYTKRTCSHLHANKNLIRSNSAIHSPNFYAPRGTAFPFVFLYFLTLVGVYQSLQSTHPHHFNHHEFGTICLRFRSRSRISSSHSVFSRKLSRKIIRVVLDTCEGRFLSFTTVCCKIWMDSAFKCITYLDF